ncbi:hypothetical protein [Phenylobacterium sp.]|uniref:hypothetical protein n=1 Tax=Phenylobacterium sp. TaxID=1871053 RepID=UPI0035B22BC6
MIVKLLAGLALAGVSLTPALAQEPPGGRPGMAPPAAATPPVNPDPMTGPSPDAMTGRASDAAARLTDSDLRPGASVTDQSGAAIGTISKVEGTGDSAMVTLSSKGKTKTVPLSSLSKSGTGLVSSTSKAEIWGPK